MRTLTYKSEKLQAELWWISSPWETLGGRASRHQPGEEWYLTVPTLCGDGTWVTVPTWCGGWYLSDSAHTVWGMVLEWQYPHGVGTPTWQETCQTSSQSRGAAARDTTPIRVGDTQRKRTWPCYLIRQGVWLGSKSLFNGSWERTQEAYLYSLSQTRKGRIFLENLKCRAGWTEPSGIEPRPERWEPHILSTATEGHQMHGPSEYGRTAHTTTGEVSNKERQTVQASI